MGDFGVSRSFYPLARIVGETEGRIFEEFRFEATMGVSNFFFHLKRFSPLQTALNRIKLETAITHSKPPFLISFFGVLYTFVFVSVKLEMYVIGLSSFIECRNM